MKEQGYMMSLDHELIQVSLPGDFKEVFKSDATNNLHEKITTSLAMAAFIEKRVTLARAAELADKSLSEFIDILSKYYIPWMEYTDEVFEVFNEDQKNTDKAKRKCQYVN